ncbi:hypothetical protein K6Q96_06760 [Grimontia kaedaensis]|uniref:Uncharacterized protein n=1 Tax=Grimontia kaedaensis TaxID=2872157 RepID=A0ABY4WXJ2_9GAMM|nr:hypothetical protein [Grimontia kaedaensis]USH03688.1 hypothetical protein K6Q96_06760 [Grimontia kaedaensis]
MNLFSNYKDIRKKISKDEYEELVRVQKTKTRIGFCLLGWSVDDRIEELEALEENYGFVFLAEKEWLLDYRDHGKQPVYSLWLKDKMWDILAGCINVVEYGEDPRWWPEKVVQFSINTEELFFEFSESIASDYILPKILVVNVPYLNGSVSLPHLVVAYELIHDFEYILQSISKYNNAEMQVESIDILSMDDPSAWLINQDGDGCLWDMPVRGRK